MKRKLFLIFLAFLCCVSGKVAAQAHEFKADGLYYKSVLGGAELVKHPDGAYTGDIVVPEKVVNLEKSTVPVVSIGEDAFRRSSVGTVTLPSSLKYIRTGAFGSSSIARVVINSYVNIEEAAFYNCTNLTEIDLTHGVDLDNQAFAECSKLETVKFKEGSAISIPSYAFSGCTSLRDINLDNVIGYGAYCFKNCESLKSVKISSRLLTYSVNDNAFREATGLETVEFPDNLLSIGDCSFYGCPNIKKVTIPEKVSSIGIAAFAKCDKLTEVVWNPARYNGQIEIFTHGSLVNTSNVEKITFGPSCELIPDILGKLDNLRTIVVGENVKSVNNRLFSYASTKLSLVEWNAVDCKDLTKDSSPSLRGAEGLVIRIGSKVERIPAYLFRFANIKSLTIPSNVKEVGTYAFYNCSNLTSLTLPNELEYIRSLAFSQCALTKVSIPYGVKEIGINAFSGNQATSVYFNAENCVTGTRWFPENVETVSFGNSVVKVPDGVFKMAEKLADVTFGLKVNEIGKEAFFRCPIESLRLMNAVANIGEYAFYGCENLKSLTLDSNVEKIEDYAFSSCSALTDITLYALYPPKIYTHSFGVSPNAKFNIPLSATERYYADPLWKALLNRYNALEDVRVDEIAISFSGGSLRLDGAAGKTVALYTLQGSAVFNGPAEALDGMKLAPGTAYILECDGKTYKFIAR